MPSRPSKKDTLQEEREKLHIMLLSSVSHDLKTPLACVIGSLEIYQQLKDTLSQEHQKTLINTAMEEARRLDSFISNIIDMAKLEQGVAITYEYADIDDLVRQCILQMEPKLRAHKVQLELLSKVVMKVNAPWISRAVTLLLDNVTQYTPAGTQVIVTVSSNTSSCKITVRDNGAGISKKIKAGIFLKHSRMARQDAKIAGTGLGLPICKAIADMHGGSIKLDTPPDGGASFTLTVPLEQHPKKKPV